MKDRVQLIDRGGFDKDKPGTYTLTYEVTDKNGLKTTKKVTLTVKMKWVPIITAPTLELTEVSIKQGEEFDDKSPIKSATDYEGNDLKDSVQLIDNGGFDKDKPGTYTLTYEVTDKNGLKTTKKVTLTVKMKLVPLIAPPTLTLTEVSIKQGEEFDEKSPVVSAADYEGNDLKGSVKLIDNGGLDNNKPGAYTLTYEVTDKNGLTITRTVTLTVEAVKKALTSSTNRAPKTGENPNIVIYAMMLMGCVVTVLSINRKKSKKQN